MMKLLLFLFLVSTEGAKIRRNRVRESTIVKDLVGEENSDQILDQAIEREGITEDTDLQRKRYAPIWTDLDTRPLPEWYDRAKVGIFLHWGVYSVPGFSSEWFWKNWHDGDAQCQKFMQDNYPPGFTYQEFAPMFTAEFFDPEAWADLFAKAGAKYVVLTSKHHDGFTMFPSTRSFSWNSVDVGPKRDIVNEVSQAVRDKNIKFGVYHSLFEWFNPIYLEDKRTLYFNSNFTLHKVWPDIKQLVNDYNPSIIWSDGDWEAFDTYWRSRDLLAWLYNDSPVRDEIVVNDRWGIGVPCYHGDFYNCDDRYNPGVLQNHKWENAFTIDSKSWGFRRNLKIDEVLTISQLIKELASTVSCGGNVLINVGPTKDGTIAPIFQERLLALGNWLSVNGEAIYDTSPWYHQNDTTNGDVWYTCNKTAYNGSQPTAVPQSSDEVSAIYAIILRWPDDDVLKVEDISSYLRSGNYKVQMLGNNDTNLNWRINKGIAYIHMTNRNNIISNHAWALKFSPK